MKPTTTTLTYTEILSRVISSIEREIEDWEAKCVSLPPEMRAHHLAVATEELRKKLDAAKILYHIETGAQC